MEPSFWEDDAIYWQHVTMALVVDKARWYYQQVNFRILG